MAVVPLPRLTRSLRAYTQLEPERNLKNSPSVISNLRMRKVNSNRRSWNDVLDYVENNQDGSRDAIPYLKSLRISARELVGPEQSEELADNAAVFLLNLFMNEKIVLMKHLSLLKQSFGSISTTGAKKICDLVQSISDILSDECKQYIEGKDNKEEVKEFGHNMTYVPSVYIPDPNRLKLLYKIRVKPSLKKISKAVDFSMKYEQTIDNSTAPPQTSYTRGSIRRFDNKFGKLWLETEVQKFNQNLSGLSTADVLQSIISMLHSPRSNDELQNELFELLGFDKFEFIEQLLIHRDDVIENLKKSAQVAEAPERPPQYLCQVTVQLEEEKVQAKLLRKEEKRLAKYHNRVVEEDTCDAEINLADMRARRQYDLTAPETNYLKMPNTNKEPQSQKPKAPVYPNVYDSSLAAKQLAGHISGHTLMLPGDVQRKNTNQFEEVYIPPMEHTASTVGQNLVPISDLDPIGQAVFQHTSSLNRIQSVVFQTAYNTNENLLVCAPTGAGKTNIALLTVVHQIRQHIDESQVMKNDFKIVYIAPMKALAAEMTASFSKKLQCVGIAVRELTGDMQLTKTEILQTHMLVTTPEKWDVVTRKGTGGVALASIVKLLIIDEVHLLHGDRGPTVEAVVARTLRQVESSQSMIRIVGLSATLPNYVDVARFLRVNPYIGLFYFDSSFRPVPLAQTFIGVKDISPIAQMNSMNEICYNKASELVQQGHQVMVFVHARNATHQTAMVLKGLAQAKAQTKIFEVPDSAAYMRAKKTISNSRNRQLADLFPYGFACHHAGMLRSDRNLVEKYFSEGFIKVLVCTSTLAWGVNLPAHGVIIRGTEIYDSKHGTFIDLGILDVLQIFGRAGRPQFDKSGTAIIITSHVKLSHYLSLFTNAFPIESNFVTHLVDNLNAEIALGTITNIDEAIEWLSYTYLFIRMRINPQVYGLNYMDVHEEPSLESKRRELIKAAAMALDKACMIRYNDRTGDLNITDLGRTASHFYIKYDTIEMFNEKINDIMTEEAIFGVLSRCQEFTQLKVRKEEISELWNMKNDNCTYQVQDCAEDLLWKINILLQTYLSRAAIDSFSLQSDLGYISQNAVRIARALFDITLRKNNPIMAGRFLLVAKMLEHQQWEWETPMRQFNVLTYDIIRKIESHNLSVDHILDLDKKELGDLLHHPKMGPVVKRCAEELPLVEMTASLHPITRTVLRIRLQITPNFRWNDRFHGKSSEPFWIWIEDPETNFMYYHEYFLLTKKQVCTREPQELVITIPLSEPLPPQYYVRAISDRWLGSESYLALSFKHLILPEIHPPHTDLLELQPLPVTALNNSRFECLYNFSHFNPIQTQIFHCLYHTDHNVLLGAPTGSGKTIAAEIAMFRVFSQYPNCKVVYIAPLKALVRERMKDWKVRLEQKLDKKVVELTGDVSPDVRAIKESHVIVTTPEKWDGISRSWQTRNYVKDVALIIIDEIHLLGEDRGPVLEVIVSRTNFIESHTSRTLRVVGLSTALANARDLANWLNIKEIGLYNFRPSVRPVPLEVHISGHPGRHYCPRMMSMNKPTFQAIRQHSPQAPALVFVSSRRQTRLTALELIAYLAAGDNPKQWLHISEVEIEQILDGVKDSNLKLTLAFGVGIHHAGLQERDRSTVEELFVNQKIQVLICTATLAWGVNFPAHLVVIKGTEFYDGKQKRYVDMPITDVLQMMGRAGRPQFDNEGVAVVLVHDIKKNFYKKFLYEPFPVESSLLEVLPDHLNAEIVAGTVQSKQDLLDYLTWTYFFRRLLQNPSYYKLENVEPQDVNHYLSTLVQNSLDVLIQANCAEIGEDTRTVYCTWMGRIASYYYMSYKTMRHFADHLLPTLTLEQLVRVLADCEEYAQLPVRHNEDILNGQLAQSCPVGVDALTLDSPHTKAFLLLQAHFSHLALPCSDYLTDLKSVLDQAIRVLQAMIDCTAENGWLSASLRCQQILQMVVQARWVQDSPLLTLPNVESHHLYLFETMAKEQQKPLTQLNGLKTAWISNYESVAGCLREEFNENDIKQIYKVVCDLPTVNVKFSIRGSWSEGEDILHVRQPPSRDEWLPLHADQEYTLVLDVTRKGANPNNIYSPKFPKNKNEGWFLSVGSLEHEELLALKRISLRGTSTQQVTFYTPVKQGRCIYTVYLMSDCYLGLDQQYDLQVNVVAPLNKNIEFTDFIPEK